MTTRELFEFDEKYGVSVAGVDEVGRGCLAGAVFAACVVLPEFVDGINDSKKLSPKTRENLDRIIRDKASYVKVGVASVEEIERFNILNASLLAMSRAADGLVCGLVLVDGNRTFAYDGRIECVAQGDAKSYAIAAASIVAKVARDRYMAELDAAYPEYGFASHKGYGTREHYEALLKFGATPEHRERFLRNLSEKVFA